MFKSYFRFAWLIFEPVDFGIVTVIEHYYTTYYYQSTNIMMAHHCRVVPSAFFVDTYAINCLGSIVRGGRHNLAVLH